MKATEVGLVEGRVIDVYQGWARTGARYNRVELETVDGPEVVWDYTGRINWARDVVVLAVKRSKDGQYLNVDAVLGSWIPHDEDKEEWVR